MKKFAVIVAGGNGSRMGETIPKQFIDLNGRPVLMHTFDAFYNYNQQIEIILVLPKNQVELWDALCKKHRFELKYKLAFGGKTRFHSVKNGLELVNSDGVVFIHDGVRPLVSKQTLENCYNTTLEKGNALPVIPANESVRVVENGKNRAVNRANYFLVQTPQTFKTELIKEASQQPFSELFTDDASVLEKFGATINLVEGNRENIKITYPEDIVISELLLARTEYDY
jgi:2-C-methyl-D-erythritol 4-phosphate cytidylyltransferase